MPIRIGIAIGLPISRGAGSSIPPAAIKDRTDDPIKDRAGNYIEQRSA